MNAETAVIHFPDSVEKKKFPSKVVKTNENWLLVGPEGHADVVEGLSD